MEEDRPQIKFPETNSALSPSFQKEVGDKFRNMDGLLYAVVVAIVITSISSLIAVVAIVIDQLHFNNQTYREYSTRYQEAQTQNKQIQDIQAKLDLLQTQLQSRGFVRK